MAKDRHHIIPRVRCRDLGVNPNFPGNVMKVSVSKHRAWHTLFSCQTPEEAIETIKRDWSLDANAKREYKRLKGNVELLKKRR